MIVDCHVHLLAEKGYADHLLRECDEIGVEKVCLLAGPDSFEFWGSRMADNAELEAAARRFPDRFFPFAFFQAGIDGPEYVDELYERGFRGLKFTWARVDYDDYSLWPVYERAEKLSLPILFHTGTIVRTPADRENDVRSTRMNPIFLDSVARHFQKLNIIGAHLGNPWFDEASMALFWNPNLHFDLSGTVLKRKAASWFREVLWWDAETQNKLAPDPEVTHYKSMAAAAHPLDRICFGTDVPIAEMRAAKADYRRLLEQMEAPPSTCRRVWGENVLKMLGELPA